MKIVKEHLILVEQLRVGIYIHLDLGWMDHPFTFGNFKIKEESQIAIIKQLGLKTLRYDPLRSDCEPLPPAAPEPASVNPLAETPAETPAETAPPPTLSLPEQAELQRSGRLQQLHDAIHTCEKEFLTSANTVREVMRNLPAQPQASRQKAETLVSQMVDSIITESDVVLHAISGNSSKEETYVHSLNVTVLALMLAKSLNMTAEDARVLGMAAIFHDIGKAEIPDRVLLKTDPLTRAEQSLVEQHCESGARLALQSGLSERVTGIILQHHEHVDGSGYPRRLKETQINSLARLLAIVNTYDNLCNPVNLAGAMTPYETLAHMFSTQRKRFDSDILKLLIKSLGIYPPGSIVVLSNNNYGIVMSVNPSKPLRPFVMIHAPDVPCELPVVLDLREEPSLNISKCLRPAQLPKEVFDYLSPRKRISYFFQTDQAATVPPDIKH
jgi:putative nucleotidyltransferase with HDIG domain